MFHTEALRLEELLADHGLAVRVGAADISTDALRFPLQLGLGATPRRLLNLSGSLAREAGYSRFRLRREGSHLFLELPRDEGAGLRYGDLLAREAAVPASGTLLGMAENGAPLSLQISAPSMHHLLISGGSEASRRTVLRVLALGMAVQHSARDWRLALLANRPNTILGTLRDLPHCWGWSEQGEHALGWLVRLTAELQAREQDRCDYPKVLALIEDVDQLHRLGGAVLLGMMKALVTRGAEVGIHIVATAGRIQGLGDLRSRFPATLQGDSEQPDRFLLASKEGQQPMRIARLDERDVESAIAYLRWSRYRVVAQPVLQGDRQ